MDAIILSGKNQVILPKLATTLQLKLNPKGLHLFDLAQLFEDTGKQYDTIHISSTLKGQHTHNHIFGQEGETKEMEVIHPMMMNRT